MQKFPSWKDFSLSFGQIRELPIPEELAILVSSKIQSSNFTSLCRLAAQLGCVLKNDVNLSESSGLLYTYSGELFNTIALSLDSRLRDYVLAHELGHIIAPSLALTHHLAYFPDKKSANMREEGYSFDEEKYLHRFAAILTETPTNSLPEDFQKYFKE